MSEPVENLILTPRTRFLRDQAIRFEEAWQSALRGGDVPSVDEFLSLVEEPERNRIARELQKIERVYRVRLSFGQAETIGSGVEITEPDDRPIEKTLMSSEPVEKRTPPAAENQETAETVPIESSAPVEADPLQSRPDPSLATLQLPGSFPAPSAQSQVFDPSAGDSSSVHLPLLDSFGGEIDVPPIAGTVRAFVGPRPFIKGYDIIGELGRGGMGVVYQANQQGLNRLVAIKMVLGGDHAREEDLARFKIEAEAVASIQHPNIVQIYEVGEKAGTPYFSLEFIDGGTLHQRIDGKPLHHDQAAKIGHQLAQAMDHFHQRGVIHRDLKPANVLMTLQGSPKITDFGLAKRLEGNSSQTRTGSLMGTPSYMAPEQASGDTRAIGPLSDLYSLGAVIYEMLTGRPPFQGATMLDTIDQVRSQEPVPPRRLQPKIPRDLETICLKCLQKEPSKRYANATELADDLGRFLEGEPIKARPIGRIELGWRWARRNPRVAFLSSSIMMIGIALMILAFFETSKTAREAQTVNDARLIAYDRVQRGKGAISTGDFRQAIEIVGLPDPFVERTPALVEVRDELRKLRAQLKTFAEFRHLLDLARYHASPGSAKKLARAKDYFRQLFALYDEIENRKGRGQFGLPPLNAWQLRLFHEDVFDTFLVAAQIEYDSAALEHDPKALKEASRIAIEHLDRAEKLLPPTRALYVRRQQFKKVVGDEVGSKADKSRGDSIEPNSPVDLFWRGNADQLRAESAVQRNGTPEAIKYYGLACDEYARNILARPEHFWAYLERANCQLRLGNRYDAMMGYLECIKLNPDASWPYHNRATAYAELKEYEKAVEDESEAIKRDPDFLSAYDGRSAAYQNLGKIDLAIADLDEAIKLSSSPGELIYKRGTLHYSLKQYDRALIDFVATLKAFPKAVAVHKDCAATRLMLRDFEGAIADWSKVAAAIPKDFESRYYVGVLRMGFHRYDEALQSLNDCLAINPDHELALVAKAHIEHWQGDDASALKSLNKVVDRIDSSKWDATTKASYLSERVDLYRNLGLLAESEADARRSIEICPKQIDAYISLALLDKRRGRPAVEARTWYDAMLKANPESADVHLRRAEYFRDLGQWDEALAEVDQARLLDKNRGPAVAELTRAGIIAAQGEGDRATAQAESILAGINRREGPALYAAACVWSLASKSATKAGHEAKARSLADRSAELLKQTLTVAYHDLEYPPKERMILDPALEPIKDRPDVMKLLSFRP